MVAVCLAATTTSADACGDITKNSYSDENCKNLVKTEVLPASDSVKCNDGDEPNTSHKLVCNGGNMSMLSYKKANCEGDYLSMARSPNMRCVKDEDTNTHVILSFSG